MSPTENNELAVMREAGAGRVSRRELAHTLLSALAAGLAVPALSPVHPISAHLLNGILLDSVSNSLAAGSHKPTFLTADQLVILDKLLEELIPGSRKAQSAEFIDQLLSVDSAKNQQEFLASLTAIEAAALSPSQLRQVLESASAKDSTDHEHFENLKNWAVGAYYSSEMGMRELGWTPNRVFSSYPVCSHSESNS